MPAFCRCCRSSSSFTLQIYLCVGKFLYLIVLFLFRVKRGRFLDTRHNEIFCPQIWFDLTEREWFNFWLLSTTRMVKTVLLLRCCFRISRKPFVRKRAFLTQGIEGMFPSKSAHGWTAVACCLKRNWRRDFASIYEKKQYVFALRDFERILKH